MTLCANPTRDRHEIRKGARGITAAFYIDWGDDDLRGAWNGESEFCSFACLADWAAQRASDHDGHVLKEGT